jgi:hypothetical protein
MRIFHEALSSQSIHRGLLAWFCLLCINVTPCHLEAGTYLPASFQHFLGFQLWLRPRIVASYNSIGPFVVGSHNSLEPLSRSYQSS